MNIKQKANILILSLSLINFKNIICEDTLDQAVTFSKGVGAAIVSGCACDGFARFFRGNSTNGQSTKLKDMDLLDPKWLGLATRTLAYAYAISKIAPYSRRCLNLKSDELLDGPMRDINKNRGKATVNAITSGIMSAACAYYAFCEIAKIKKDTLPDDALYISRALALCYSLYKFAPDAYRHMRVSFAI